MCQKKELGEDDINNVNRVKEKEEENTLLHVQTQIDTELYFQQLPTLREDIFQLQQTSSM